MAPAFISWCSKNSHLRERIGDPKEHYEIRKNIMKMDEQIFILNKNNELIELDESDFVNEDQFQSLLENYPRLISGSQIDPDNPRKWILISREIGIPGEEGGNNIWSLDHLFIDQDGIPTLVEVKRSSDTRIRREVVGQMLDYAANSVRYWTIKEIREKFERKCENEDLDPNIELSELVGSDMDSEKFWSTVDTNLQAGKIRLLFIADRIPRKLQRIIEFLNEQMSPAEVLGVEIKQFANTEIKTLVPRVIGKTSNAEIKKGVRQFNKWTEETFLEELKNRNGPEVEKIVRNLIKHLEGSVSRLWYGEGKQSGSLIPIVDKKEHSNQLIAIYTYGRIEIYFQHLRSKPPFNAEEIRIILLGKLNNIQGIDLPQNKIDKRPSFEIRKLDTNLKEKEFQDVIDWVIEEINKVQE